ncbi:MAG: hypothetical protein P1T08_06475 [Acidimicrobiia bacterium]|nr:hypothetical protein [Acidimicrobiia bacterium]
MPAVDVGGWAAVLAPGRARLTENLWLARRTYSTVHFLMHHTDTVDTPAGDFTEDAGVLMRRLLELLAQTSWLTDYEPPADLALPANIGERADHEALARTAPWPDEESLSFVLAYLAAAVDWIDVQALRADRAELAQQLKTARALAGGIAGEKASERHAAGIALIENRDALIEARLDTIGAPRTPRSDTTGILTRLGGPYVMAWRYESDAAHAMAMGRLHQRGLDEEPMLGAPSPPWRREMVVSVANATMLEMGSRVLGALEADTSELQAATADHRELLEARASR